MEDLMKLKFDSSRIFLDGTEIKGLKSYEVKVSTEELSILNMTLYVDTFGDKEEQDVSNKKRVNRSIDIKVGSKELDEAIEKANQLIELLGKAQKIVDSLSGQRRDINEIVFRMSSKILKQLNESKSGGTRVESRQKQESLINKGVLERVNQLVIDERKTGALNLADLENRINNDAPKAIADEALKIYSMTKNEGVALSALALILNAVQL